MLLPFGHGSKLLLLLSSLIISFLFWLFNRFAHTAGPGQGINWEINKFVDGLVG
jgi:hypothetical protein